jgi:hypothetical protein
VIVARRVARLSSFSRRCFEFVVFVHYSGLSRTPGSRPYHTRPDRLADVQQRLFAARQFRLGALTTTTKEQQHVLPQLFETKPHNKTLQSVHVAMPVLECLSASASITTAANILYARASSTRNTAGSKENEIRTRSLQHEIVPSLPIVPFVVHYHKVTRILSMLLLLLEKLPPAKPLSTNYCQRNNNLGA